MAYGTQFVPLLLLLLLLLVLLLLLLLFIPTSTAVACTYSAVAESVTPIAKKLLNLILSVNFGYNAHDISM